ncbi:DUF89 family protein [candidate division WOR-3 bacterium]|nr:DUF89 family protein [candidate division WOR-3 bacterium]
MEYNHNKPERSNLKSDPRCTPCLVRQLERSAKAMKVSSEDYDQLLAKARKEIPSIPLSLAPNLYSTRLLQMIYHDGANPYKEEKIKHNKEVAEILPLVRKMVERSDTPQKTALLAASLGNVIDLGTQEQIDTYQVKEFLREAEFERDDSDALLESLEDAEILVYVVDNAGEVLLDRLCAEYLAVPDTYFIAKEAPILNDVTAGELIELGFPENKVLSTGSNDLGINWQTLNPETRDLMRKADAVIAKGHANFESFIDGPQEAFLVLKVKCQVVAEKIREDCGSLVCLHYEPR